MIMRKSDACELLPILVASALLESFVWSSKTCYNDFGAQGALVAGLIAFPFLWILLTIYRKKVGSYCPKWFTYILVCMLVLSIAKQLVEYQRFYTQVLGSHLPFFWFIAVTLAVAAYGQSMSDGALGRTAQIVLGFLVLSMALLLISASDQMRVEGLDCTTLGKSGLISALSMRLTLIPEFLLFPVLGARSSRRSCTLQNSFVLPAIVFITDSVLITALELIMGNGWQGHNQPVYMLARLGTFSVFRRMDAIHLCVWLMLFFLRISFYFWVIGQLLQDTPLYRGKTSVFCSSSILALLLFAIIPKFTSEILLAFHQLLLWCILLIPFFWKRGKLQ